MPNPQPNAMIEVTVNKSPVTTRYVNPGDTGHIDPSTQRIKVRGVWFDFQEDQTPDDDKWRVTYTVRGSDGEPLQIDHLGDALRQAENLRDCGQYDPSQHSPTSFQAKRHAYWIDLYRQLQALR